jgi:hypothetical protein
VRFIEAKQLYKLDTLTTRDLGRRKPDASECFPTNLTKATMNADRGQSPLTLCWRPGLQTRTLSDETQDARHGRRS